MKRIVFNLVLVVALLLGSVGMAQASSLTRVVGVNVMLKGDVTPAKLADLAAYGKVRNVIYEIDALTMQAVESKLDAIRALPYVAAANLDAERSGSPVKTESATGFVTGMSTWDLDAIDVTDFGAGRTIDLDGTGVFVAVLDTGLLKSWPAYFPAARIATEFAKAFGGGGGEVGWVSSQPNKWQTDTDSHGTHVTSTILGYNLLGTAINGVAPMAKVIPVKVLNNNGSGWSSVVAAGITYVGKLKETILADYPVVINMSLGGPVLDSLEKAAIDYAVSKGVIIVASAGNNGMAGMGYPGAYAPVISVAASGWTGEWSTGGWWRTTNVPDPTSAADFYITDFSSRAKTGQDLDVAAPGSWVVGPYQTNNGQLSFYYLGGTSMASPHVAGIVALMAQKNHSLTAGQAEDILVSSAIPLAPGCRTVDDGYGAMVEYCWEADATGAGLANALTAILATP